MQLPVYLPNDDFVLFRHRLKQDQANKADSQLLSVYQMVCIWQCILRFVTGVQWIICGSLVLKAC